MWNVDHIDGRSKAVWGNDQIMFHKCPNQ
jgi:hypothetical protein